MPHKGKPYFWQEKPFTYPVCVAPIRKPFCELTHDETEAYFQWHLSVLRERIDVLSDVVCRDLHIPRKQMDFSPESLVLLWRWFLGKAEVEQTPKAKLRAFWENDPHPEAFKADLMKGMQKQFSLETVLVLQDIGKYLGEVFVKNLPEIYWSYYETPKTDFFVNMPLLKGFSDADFTPLFPMEFEPVHMAGVQAARILSERQQEKDLYNIYSLWATRYYHGERK